MDKVVILDNVRSTHNVGSIFRTSDAAGVSKLFLLGITPSPLDRFGRQQPEIAKTALGATDSVPWEKVGEGDSLATDEGVALLQKLNSNGYTVVAVEQAENAVLLHDFEPPEKIAYILGAEVEGVQPELIATADVVLEIPMLGMKESLNVSVTAGIVLFR
jgi:23S rRNA (guanosine2251-2'-O)-methyltransferase